jgi:hypothetical protein
VPKQVEVSWSRTEEFIHTFTVEDDFTRENPVHEEALLDQIGNLTPYEELDAYDCCPDLSIIAVTDKEESADADS